LKPKQEKSVDRTMLRFKVCLWCGHLQNVQMSNCDKCEAGNIGLGKPREMWAYLDLKIESILKLPEPLAVVLGYKAELAKRQVEKKLDE
jgi:hypothetical protein